MVSNQQQHQIPPIFCVWLWKKATTQNGSRLCAHANSPLWQAKSNFFVPARGTFKRGVLKCKDIFAPSSSYILYIYWATKLKLLLAVQKWIDRTTVLDLKVKFSLNARYLIQTMQTANKKNLVDIMSQKYISSKNDTKISLSSKNIIFYFPGPGPVWYNVSRNGEK